MTSAVIGNTVLDALINSLADKRATIGVLGLGYVGLPLAVAFAEANFSTICFDTKVGTVKMLQRGESHIGDIVGERITALQQNQKFSASNNFDRRILKKMGRL